MHLDKEFLISGVPAKDLRKILKRTRFSTEEFLNLLPDTVEKPTCVWDQLLVDGYIVETSSGRGVYEPTLKGRTLANATLRRYSRQAADKAVYDMLTRLLLINLNQEFAYSVEAIRIFGSYITERPDVGDVDIAYKLRPWSCDHTQQEMREKERRQAHTGLFKTFVDELFWPKEEVRLSLRNRSPLLRLHDFDEPAKLNAPFVLVFHADEPAWIETFLKQKMACALH